MQTFLNFSGNAPDGLMAGPSRAVPGPWANQSRAPKLSLGLMRKAKQQIVDNFYFIR